MKGITAIHKSCWKYIGRAGICWVSFPGAVGGQGHGITTFSVSLDLCDGIHVYPVDYLIKCSLIRNLGVFYVTVLLSKQSNSRWFGTPLLWHNRVCILWDVLYVPFSIRMEIPRQKLVAIVGQVGCGKSSLINALLGELHSTRGQAELNVRQWGDPEWRTQFKHIEAETKWSPFCRCHLQLYFLK